MVELQPHLLEGAVPSGVAVGDMENEVGWRTRICHPQWQNRIACQHEVACERQGTVYTWNNRLWN